MHQYGTLQIKVCYIYLSFLTDYTELLEEDKYVIIKESDVHNIFQKANLKALCAETHTWAQMHHLKDKHVTATVAVDNENYVRHIFWQADPSKALPAVTTTISLDIASARQTHTTSLS